MAEWVMILVVTLTGQPPSVTSTGFGTQQACLNAGRALEREARGVDAQEYLAGRPANRQVKPVWFVCAPSR